MKCIVLTIFLIILQGMQIHMKSDRGEIEVFLCPEEEALNSHFGASASVLTSEESATEDNDSDAVALPSPIKIKQEVNDHLDSTPTNRAFSTPNQMAASNHQTWEEGDDQAIKNVLIFESEDLGPIGNRFQQQTVDQEHHGKQFIVLLRVYFEFSELLVGKVGKFCFNFTKKN